MIKGTFDVNKPSEEARYLASYLKLREDSLINVRIGWNYETVEELDEYELVKLIDEYFNSRR